MQSTKPAVLVTPQRHERLAKELEADYDVHRYWLIEDQAAFLAGRGKGFAR